MNTTEQLIEYNLMMKKLLDGLKNENSKNYLKAYESYMDAVSLGSSEAAYYAATMKFNGKGVPEDFEVAVALLTYASDKGFSDASKKLATLNMELLQEYEVVNNWFIC